MRRYRHIEFVIILICICFLAITKSVYGFTPLKSCPGFTQASNALLENAIQEALEAENLVELETYLALLQCRLGQPHSIGSERYIMVQKTSFSGLSSSLLKEQREKIIKALENKMLNTRPPLNPQQIDGYTSILKALVHLTGKEKESASNIYLGKARIIADHLLALQNSKSSDSSLYTNDLPKEDIARLNVDAAMALIDLYRITGEVVYMESAMRVEKELGTQQRGLDFLSNAAYSALRTRLAYELMKYDEFDDILFNLELGVFSGLYESGSFKGHFLTPEAERLESRYRIARFLLIASRQFPTGHAGKYKTRQAADFVIQAIYSQYAQKKGIQTGAGSANLICALYKDVRKVDEILEPEAYQSYKATLNFLISQVVFSNKAGLRLDEAYVSLCLLDIADYILLKD